MAMHNMYNYKKPSNYYHQVKGVKAEAPVVAKAAPLKKTGEDYLEQKILAARPEELTLMLYDGVIKFLNQSKLYIEQENLEKSNGVLIRAQDIISELNVTLNMDYEISNNLRMLYVYMNTRLVEANIRKSTELVDEVLELAVGLRDTWKEAMQTLT